VRWNGVAGHDDREVWTSSAPIEMRTAGRCERGVHYDISAAQLGTTGEYEPMSEAGDPLPPPPWIPNNANDRQAMEALNEWQRQAVRAGFPVQHVARIVIPPYAETLLATASRLFLTDREFTLAVIVSVMACEIAADVALSRAFASKGLGDLEDAVRGLFSGSTLNGRGLPLFITVTGLEVQKQPFWQGYKTAAKNRNDAIHKGMIANGDEAKAAIEAASSMVAFLK
jgi:hypothetical protein